MISFSRQQGEGRDLLITSDCPHEHLVAWLWRGLRSRRGGAGQSGGGSRGQFYKICWFFFSSCRRGAMMTCAEIEKGRQKRERKTKLNVVDALRRRGGRRGGSRRPDFRETYLSSLLTEIARGKRSTLLSLHSKKFCPHEIRCWAVRTHARQDSSHGP